MINTSLTMAINSNSTNTSAKISKAPFGKTPDGKEINSYTVINSNALEMRVINYGGIITHLFTPDRNNKMGDIVLGFDSIDGYLKEPPYFGALIGRYGNRIMKGEFSIDNEKFQLEKNNIGNHLHGGTKGYDKVFWDINEIDFSNDKALKLSYNSKDREGGYPGNLSIEVIYYLSPNNELEIYYSASTDKKTIINLTQHTYFNLTANPTNTIPDHEVKINAKAFLPVDNTLIPTGEFRNVKDTPFDFSESKKVKIGIDELEDQLKFAGGYDHCWVLDKNNQDLTFAASAYENTTGRKIEVYTTEPGIQFYSGNFLDGTLIGKGGIPYKHRTGFCLETEHFPDSPNRPEFPSVVLEPSAKYESKTVYKFLK